MNSSIAFRIRCCEEILLFTIGSSVWTKSDPIRGTRATDRLPLIAPVRQPTKVR
jgi:hypothetical protein